MIWGLPSQAYDSVRGRLTGYLESVVERSCGRWTLDALEDAIRSADGQVWVANDFDAIGITSVDDTGVTVEAVTGTNRQAWAEDGMAEIEAWARSLGKQHLRTLARPGWTKTMQEAGFREVHREFVKELTDGQ